MISRLVLLIFISLTIQQIDTNQPLYQLSPPIPPTSFVGQIYTCQFRVIGLDFPTFKFDGLPSGFNSSTSGLIKGTPAQTGSFLITISYSSNSYKESKQTILRVALSGDSPANTKIIDSLYPRFSISSDTDTYIYMAGVQIQINFNAEMGRPPYYWAYLRLPTELKGTVNGTVSGIFGMEGYYSFGVTCSDSAGNSTDAFFTLSIQPITFFTTYAPQHARPIVDVPVRDTLSKAIWQQADQLQALSLAYLVKAAQVANQAGVNLTKSQQNLAKTNNSLFLAKQSVQSAENQYTLTSKKRDSAQAFFVKTKEDLTAINQTLNLKKQGYQLFRAVTNDAKKKLQLTQQTVGKLSQSLQKASNDFISAQNNSTSASYKLVLAHLNYTDAQSTFQNAQTVEIQAKQQLQKSTLELENIIDSINQAQGQVDASKMGKIIASQTFNNKSKALDNALNELENANKVVASLKESTANAMKDVGQAKYRLTMALNQLYIAQAAKQQADKAIIIINSQNLQQISSNLIFLGCNQGAYPSTFGSGSIKQKIQSGYLLDSGQKLLQGTCTQAVICSKGDLIYFEGYLRNGSVHLIRYSKQ